MAVEVTGRQQLDQSFRGQLIWPEHPDYDRARAVFNGAIDRRPVLIARPLDAADAAAAIEFARAQDLAASIRGGGHSVAGHAVADDALMIDLRLMRDVTVDAERRLADAGGGATWNDVDPACQRHGLATPGGTFGTTGVGGLTLGGGIGHLMGQYGLTLDNLAAAEVVTADGRVVVASAEENDDLFWGLRGGGGNFGVVTRFTYDLHEVDAIEGGLLVYDFGRASEVVRLFRDVVDGTPDELTLFLVIGGNRATGEMVVVVSVCWSGTSQDARARLDALRSAPGLLADDVRTTSYLRVQAIFGESPFGFRQYWKGHFLSRMPDELIDLLVEHFTQRRSPGGGLLIEPLQGAATRVPDDAMAFAHRSARFNVTGMTTWASPADDAEEIAWVRACADAIAPYSARGGGYVNYMAADEPLERVEAAFGAERFARLRQLKRKFDPDNLFRLNQNIPPAD
jgi:FAD/FMN-containing dehydrogenase